MTLSALPPVETRITGNAQALSDELLATPAPTAGATPSNQPVTVIHYYDYSTPQFDLNSCSSGPAKDWETTVKVVAAVVALTASYFVGSAIGVLRRISHTQATLESLKTELLSGTPAESQTKIDRLIHVLSLEKQILDGMSDREKVGLCLKAVLAISSAACCIGLIRKGPSGEASRLVAGLTGSTATTAAGLLLMRAGYKDTDTKPQEGAQFLRLAVQAAKV
jgi:hypothetical protein